MSNSLDDIIGGANLYGGSGFSFTNDRFCVKSSALYLDYGGFVQIPADICFSQDFTITAWIYLLTNKLNLLQLGNPYSINNITINLNNSRIYFQIFNSSIEVSTKLNLYEWYYFSFVLSGKTGYIYFNGNQIATGHLATDYSANNNKTSNFIGNIRQVLDERANIDEIKFYKRALTSNEIMKEYINTSLNGINNFRKRTFENLIHCFFFSKFLKNIRYETILGTSFSKVRENHCIII